MSADESVDLTTLNKSDYKQYPRTLAADDYWGQVRRTVRGVPVGEDQIQMIVDAIVGGLELRPADVVLDVACGNGALSRYLYPLCSALLGVDFSDYLISVAKDNFEDAPRFSYVCDDAAHYVGAETDPGRFTKVLCYGSFSFFPPEVSRSVLAGLRERFTNVERVFIGNLPDRVLAHLFYDHGLPDAAVLEDHTEQIGTWRSQTEFADLAAECGWHATFTRMPDNFFARLYRYDVLLTPA
jgi:SAM-dependent methyltransferase